VAADAKQVVTGHAEISGKAGHVSNQGEARIFSHKNFAVVDFRRFGGATAGIQVRNLENKTIRVTYDDNGRVSSPVKPGDTEHFDFVDPDVGIADLSHKYATLNVDWGLRADDSCDFAVHTILHFPDGTPLNG
jgi:hypothetical protein